MITGTRIAEIVESYVGTPFRHHGRRPGIGLDCVGVSVCGYRAAGVEVRDDTTYPPSPPAGLLLHLLRRNLGPPRTSIRVGDQLAFWLDTRGKAVHVATALPGGRLLHVMQGRRVVVMPSISRWWQKRLAAIYGVR